MSTLRASVCAHQCAAHCFQGWRGGCNGNTHMHNKHTQNKNVQIVAMHHAVGAEEALTLHAPPPSDLHFLIARRVGRNCSSEQVHKAAQAGRGRSSRDGPPCRSTQVLPEHIRGGHSAVLPSGPLTSTPCLPLRSGLTS